MLSKLRHSNSELFLFLLLDLGHDFDFLLAPAILNETMIFHETLTITKTQRMAVDCGCDPVPASEIGRGFPSSMVPLCGTVSWGLQDFFPILGFKCTLP